MIIEDSIKIKNYKCFGENLQGFEKICPINVIIGKNNSGKSSLIDLLKTVIDGDSILFLNKRNKLPAEIYISTGPETVSLGLPKTEYYSQYKEYDCGSITYTLLDKRIKKVIEWENELPRELSGYKATAEKNIVIPFEGKQFRQITAERDIKPEGGTNIVALDSDGGKASSLIQMLITNSKHDTSLINRKLLKELNKILNPEIDFSDIQIQQHEKDSLWEIYFEDKEHGYIALSKMGSGIKTVLLVLLNLIVIPELKDKSKSDYVFAFEELENNLHPALLRRLFAYIKKYSEAHKAYFFITTHSSVIIDFFGNDENAQIVHIQNDKQNSTCTTASRFLHNKHILRDLDVRASDLLQSNGIIWVEGPSDRIYINKCLSLIAPDLQEGLHYSIMFYGGKLLANLELKDSNWFDEELVPLLKINTNAFVVIDRDGDGSKPINETKQKRINEIGLDKSWVTHGREIENYLTDDTLNNWLSATYKFSKKVLNNIDTKLEDNITNSEDNVALKYNTDKKGYAIEIAEFITAEDINHYDLKNKLDLLIKNIKEWNAIN